jgi:hypothetical protein
MKILYAPLVLALLSPQMTEAATLKFTGVLDSLNSSSSSAPFTLTVSFDPLKADATNTTADSIDLQGGNDISAPLPSLFTESVKIEVNGSTLISVVDTVPNTSHNFILNNKDVGPTSGTQFKNEISSDVYFTLPDNSVLSFQIDLNTVLASITPFIALDFDQTVSLSYPGAYFNFYQTDPDSNIILEGSGTPTTISLNTIDRPRNSVPAPSTWSLFALGLIGMVGQRRKLARQEAV